MHCARVRSDADSDERRLRASARLYEACSTFTKQPPTAAVVEEMLQAGADPQYMPSGSVWSMLHWLARHDRPSPIPRLVAAGGDVHAVDTNGRTALHIASSFQSRRANTALLQAGSDPLLRSGFGLLADPDLTATYQVLPHATEAMLSALRVHALRHLSEETVLAGSLLERLAWA